MRTGVAIERAGSDVVCWRRDRLLETGFSLPLAARLVRDPRYDLHALIELVERGCSPALAMTILEPLDELPAA